MSERPGTARVVLRALVAIALPVTLLACAAPPQKEMDQAEGAIVTARAAGAAEYARGEFEAAETALRRSHEAVAQRDYRQALNHALDARERAQTAAREAADKKAQARGEAERAITAAELALATAMQRTRAAADGPPARRVPGAVSSAQKMMRTTVETASAALQEARSHLEAQRYDLALRSAAPLPEQIREATSAYDAAVTAPASARPGRRGR